MRTSLEGRLDCAIFGADRILLTSECERELEERDSSSSARPEAVMHDINVGCSTTELGIYDNKSYRPICDTAQGNKKYQARHETCLSNGIRQAYSISSSEVHERGAVSITDDSCEVL